MILPMKKLMLISIIFALCFVACRKDDDDGPPPPPPPAQKNAIDLLPKDNEISGWTKSEAVRIAGTPDELTAIIDGEAVPYINNNFKDAVFQKYQGVIGSNTITLEVRIFDMRDTANTRKVYQDVAAGGEQPWNNHPGVEGRINDSFLFDYMVEFWEAKFYTRIFIQERSAAALDIAKTFGLNISAAIKE